MYIPEIYKNNNPEEVRAFLKENAFGILVTHSEGKSIATHIPLLFEVKEDGREMLHGHIARANEQAAHLRDGMDVLCIFNGPHSYVSASWYDFEEVSTWNYIAVQVRGKLSILDKNGLRKSLKTLMDTYEAPQENPIDINKLSDKTMRQINGIIGFEIEITSIEAAKKMSQNRDDKNHASIISRLREKGESSENAVADEMEAIRKKI